MVKGHQDDAPTTLIMTTEFAKCMFIDNEQAKAMKGFVTRKIKVEGNMTTLMKMQKAKLSEAQLALAETIAGFTE